MSKNDIIVFVMCAIFGAGSVIASIVVAALKIQHAIITEFANHRKFVYQAFRQRDKAIRRLEFWAVSRDTEHRAPYQPGIDPIDFGDVATNGDAN